MKELVLLHLKNVQVVLNNFIYPLKDKYDPFGRFNYYWDVLEFIQWIKINEPHIYEENNLAGCFYTLNEFGEVYLKVFPSQTGYRHEDGILGIDVALENMIKQFYDYIINLQESEIPPANSIVDSDGLSLKEIMAGIKALQVTIDTAIAQKPIGDTYNYAKEIVKEVLNPIKPSKKLTPVEEFKAEVANKVAERKLKLVQKSAKRS